MNTQQWWTIQEGGAGPGRSPRALWVPSLLDGTLTDAILLNCSKAANVYRHTEKPGDLRQGWAC